MRNFLTALILCVLAYLLGFGARAIYEHYKAQQSVPQSAAEVRALIYYGAIIVEKPVRSKKEVWL